MYYYMIFGFNVASDFALEGAYEIEKPEKVQITIRKELFDDTYMELSDLEKNDDGVVIIKHFEENWACMRLKKHGVFMIENGDTIKYNLYPWYERGLVSQFFLCVCMTILLIQRKSILLHGSAILYKGKTLVISGESGAGKSSLSSEIMSRGYKQMSDDIVSVGESEKGMVAYPSFPIRKLCADFVEKQGLNKEELIPMPDEDREKYGLILKDEYHNQKELLGAMVIIRARDVEEPILEEIMGADKLKYLTQNFFRQEVYEQVPFKPEDMMRAIKLAGQMPIYVLTRPLHKMTVKEQADLIENTI